MNAKDGEKEAEKEGEKKDANSSQVRILTHNSHLFFREELGGGGLPPLL